MFLPTASGRAELVEVIRLDGLFEIAFCFRCHGARLRGPTVPADQQLIHGFDSESTAGRELPARFRASDHG